MIVEVKAKVYYDISNGNILTITPEAQGAVKETTKEEDIELYPALKEYNIKQIEFLELEYGLLSTLFYNLKSYSVNIETKELDLVYYNDSELQAAQDKWDEAAIDVRVNNISKYLLDQQSDVISSFEDFIMQTELNKITEGMN